MHSPLVSSKRSYLARRTQSRNTANTFTFFFSFIFLNFFSFLIFLHLIFFNFFTLFTFLIFNSVYFFKKNILYLSMFHVHRDSYTAVSNNTRPTPRTRVGALSRCHPGHRDTPVGPGRTPTVHRCPRGEAVGGPSTNTTHVVRRSTEHIT